jgi:hypothetical protein
MDIYAEDLPYWQTSKVSAETWREKAEIEIKRAGGMITSSGDVMQNAKSAVFIAFSLDSEPYRVAFPVLESKKGNQKAAKVQAATMMYHDIKARCVALRVLGARTAFGGYRVLPDGRTDGHVSTPELAAVLPLMLVGGA